MSRNVISWAKDWRHSSWGAGFGLEVVPAHGSHSRAVGFERLTGSFLELTLADVNSFSELTAWEASMSDAAIIAPALEHDPEKWVPVFGKRSCSKKKLEWDDDSKRSHHPLG